jgi:hypothetical protein
MAGQRHRQMLREQPIITQDQDALFRVFRKQLRPGDQQHGLARASHAIDDAMTIPQGTRIALLAQVEHREIGLAGANDHLWMDDAAEDIDLRRRQLREGPPRIETSLEPCQQGLRLERIPGGQFVARDGRAGWEQEGQLLRLALDLAAVDVAQHRNVAEREGIAAGMAAFLLHQHARLRVPAALIHQPQHISARLPARMRDNRGNTTPRDRDRVRVDAPAPQLG